MTDDNTSVFTESTQQGHGHKRKDMIQRIIDKLSNYMQKDENKRWLQVFILDPVLNHIFDRLFPYIILMCIVMVVLIILIVVTFFLVFTKLGSTGVSATTLGVSI